MSVIFMKEPICTKEKMRIYKTYARSIMTYAGEIMPDNTEIK